MKEFKITEIKEWKYKPLTMGLWRPYEVEVGFITDYINQHCITIKKPEVGEWVSMDNIIAL